MSQFAYRSEGPVLALSAPTPNASASGQAVARSWAKNTQDWQHNLSRPIGFDLDPMSLAQRIALSLIRQIRSRALGDEDEGVFFIYDNVDSLLAQGSFLTCDRLLREHFDDLPLIFELALLSITWPAKDALSHRASFAQRLRARLTREDPERVEDLLSGLE